MALDSDIKQDIQEAVQNAFGAALSLDYLYNQTARKAGYTVPESPAPRDLIDEGDLVDSLDIIETGSGLTLRFSDDANVQMFQRPEVVDEVISLLPIEDIVKDLILNNLKGKL